MTKLKDAVAGDVGDTRIVTLNGVTDLTGVTAIEAHVWRATGAVVTLTASVLSAVNRTVTINLGTNLSTGWLPAVAVPGEYNIEVQASFGSTVLTWPNGTPDTLTVRAQGA